MPAGIGMDVGQREADLAALTASQMAEALVNLLRALAGRHTERYSDDLDRGMKLLSGHVKQGGLVKQSILDEAGADTFAGCLREHFVPYLQLQVQTEEGEKCIFFTRGGSVNADRPLPDDTKGLEKAWEDYVEQTMRRLQQNILDRDDEPEEEIDERSIRNEREVDHM